jgi:hypothetical protein
MALEYRTGLALLVYLYSNFTGVVIIFRGKGLYLVRNSCEYVLFLNRNGLDGVYLVE